MCLQCDDDDVDVNDDGHEMVHCQDASTALPSACFSTTDLLVFFATTCWWGTSAIFRNDDCFVPPLHDTVVALFHRVLYCVG